MTDYKRASDRCTRQSEIAGRKEMIDREHKLSVVRQARLLGVSRSSLYYSPRPVLDGDLTWSNIRRSIDHGLAQPYFQLDNEALYFGEVDLDP